MHKEIGVCKVLFHEVFVNRNNYQTGQMAMYNRYFFRDNKRGSQERDMSNMLGDAGDAKTLATKLKGGSLTAALSRLGCSTHPECVEGNRKTEQPSCNGK